MVSPEKFIIVCLAVCADRMNIYIFPLPVQSVTLHTDLGDIKIELYCELVPKACEVWKLCSN